MRQKSLTRSILQPLAIALGLAVVVRGAMRIYSIPSASMSPTLQIGDHIVVTPYFDGDPRRGDVVVFRMPSDPGALVVKRVIGVPGDLIDSRLGRVRIGEHTLTEPYLLADAATGAIEAQIVPPRSYFVMGDNRANSLDSRSWGTLPREQIVGRARMVLWSSSWSGGDGDSADAANASPLTAEGDRARRDAGLRIFKWVE
ncbi:MAG TPA: signal peptidase I [Thermoanaerobaculia bacterium]|nr:signal peptidase I [Thermoanaerobaculia bacterium]